MSASRWSLLTGFLLLALPMGGHAREPSPRITVVPQSVQEGDQGVTLFPVMLELDGPAPEGARLNFSVTGRTATNGSDLIPLYGTLTIPPGARQVVLPVPVLADRIAERDETLTLRLYGARNLTLGTRRVQLTIEDDDGDSGPVATISPVAFTEGDHGVSLMVFELTLDRPSARRLSFSYRTLPQTALAGSDFVPVRGRVTLSPGQQKTALVVPILGDRQAEPDETFQLTLRAPRGVSLAQEQVTGTILDDDEHALPRLELLSAQAVEGDNGTTPMHFQVQLDGPAPGPVQVSYATSDETAHKGMDYQSVEGTLTIPTGGTSAVIEVPIYGDTSQEENETFRLHLNGLQGAVASNLTATGTIVDDDLPPPPDSGQACEHKGSGTLYAVGPGQPYSELGQVPWEALGAGDLVRIHYRPTPYREKIIISTGGNQDEPLRICGVPGPNGERPILDGDGATNSPQDAAAYGTYRPMEGLALIMIWNRDYHQKVSHLIIEGLHLRNAKSGFRYLRTDGTQDQYEEGVACIRIQAADDVVIRDNEIENCDNGIFTMSQGYNEAHLTRNLLIEGNHIHGHGTPGSDRAHGVYIQALGVVYQYNRFGPNDPRSGGTTLKERVAGSVIRYNWFDGGSSRALDLVEVEDAAPWYLEEAYLAWAAANGQPVDPQRLAKVRQAEMAYRDTWVYGNYFKHIGSQSSAGSLVHYGWDNDPALSREGRLHFFNNSVLIRQDRSEQWRFRLFDLRQWWDGTFARETVKAYNNIIQFEAETPGKASAYFCMGSNSGTIELGINWMPMGWDREEVLVNCYYSEDERPVVLGSHNLLDTTGAPAPLDPETLASREHSLIRNQAQPVPRDHPLDRQYQRHLSFQSRSNARDLGAMELP